MVSSKISERDGKSGGGGGERLVFSQGLVGRNVETFKKETIAGASTSTVIGVEETSFDVAT